jgi:hypothetical protein
MELANIEKLIEKYLNAESSLQEESTLKTYFLSENVAPHLQEYQSMFSYFQHSKDETYTKTIQLETKKKNYRWLSVAASVALLISVFVGKQAYEDHKQKVLFNQVQTAIGLLSKNLNKGDKAVATLYTYENTVNKIFKTK